jgi:rhodanese-related sulfurtransferase
MNFLNHELKSNIKKGVSRMLFTMVLCFTAVLTSCSTDTKNEIKTVSAEEMQTLLDLEDVQLVDVRTPGEFNTGFIAKAQNIDFRSPTFDADISKLDKDKPVVLYCKSGGRSAKCAKKMKDAGFTKIYDLQGGISKWKHDGFDLEENL